MAEKENYQASQKRTDRPRIGITIGDYNGVGPEIILKVLQDKRLTNFCTPVIYGSGKILTKYKRLLNIENFSYHQYNNNSYLNEKKPNVVNCWIEAQELQVGKVTKEAGECAYLALKKSTEDLKAGFLDAVVTCPINKANIQQEEFQYAGHTEYYTENFGEKGKDSLMLLCAGDLRVGVITGHIPLSEVPKAITRELIIKKSTALIDALKKDFGIQKPKIAILGLNPHAGEEGLLGNEEKNVIAPTIRELKKKGNLVYGPYPSDGFFGTLMYKEFDGVLAMYHDQGLIPFKTLAFDNGVNYTAGLNVIRTSPDHGTAYNIAGKGIASEESLREAIYLAIDVVRNRNKVTGYQIRPEAQELLQQIKDREKKGREEKMPLEDQLAEAQNLPPKPFKKEFKKRPSEQQHHPKKEQQQKGGFAKRESVEPKKEENNQGNSEPTSAE
ncbi:4-hydroxythreonine-4-phosphate dehydrogenase PdxA [Sediminitomix flava]|uniref:4-hydroxythreonine-4-phosphate dehydrogenase n=1 Tax=Sediminitomix flava TaxID=379075 RepID=A0A315ZBL1_SEDFL|nr:4-hydroxythreonine-4-phosphate dehydrogenase PdxA [Sediminitomix flava]PWJ42750.1 4-hydroxythreonine-4-phosphate dehydrogenase [Sediminitomix flava]